MPEAGSTRAFPRQELMRPFLAHISVNRASSLIHSLTPDPDHAERMPPGRERPRGAPGRAPAQKLNEGQGP